MNLTKIESDKEHLLQILPELVWEQVLRDLATSFQHLESCSKASDYFDTLLQRMGHLSVVSRNKNLSRNYHERIDCAPWSTGLILFPEPIFSRRQITVMNICLSISFRPINDYLKWFITSQRDSLQTLHISCLGIRKYLLKLPEMGKLRNLQIVRNVTLDKEKYIKKSLRFCAPPVLPALESLTLSAFGTDEDWYDFLVRYDGSKEPRCPSCPTVQHLRLLPSRQFYIRRTSTYISDKFVFPNLVSLEIPAVFLDAIYFLFAAPQNLRRLTLTLPTRGLHKHLFDVSITGYNEQVCAAILANPNRNRLKIRTEVAEENECRLDDFEEWEQTVMEYDNVFRRQRQRYTNLTLFTGLAELRLKSDTGDWGPTVVSCRDLLNMRSLKTIHFCGFKPKYIPEDMMKKLRKRFTVQTPDFDLEMDFNPKIEPHKPTLCERLPGAVWKQVFGCVSSSFQIVESSSEASYVLQEPSEKSKLLSISRRDIIRPDNFRQWLYSLSEGPRPAPQVLPRIKTFDISINSNFQPLGYYLNSLLESQRDFLESLHLSCLGLKTDCLEIEFPGMNKLRDLQIVRNVKEETGLLSSSLQFSQPPVVPVLETLTLSSFGWGEHWDDFLRKPDGSENPEYPTCETVTHLRLLPSRPSYLFYTIFWIQEDFVFPNLVCLEIPAILLALICPLLDTPESLKRLTLTVPTRGLHKHLFDTCLTGYGEQVCSAILADPDRDPAEIRAEIEEENYQEQDRRDQDHDLCYERFRIVNDYFHRQQGLRCSNITNFSGLEKLWIKSDTGDWGPTLVSCPDLLNMKSLKTLRFCGHKPKYIPDNMIRQMKDRFTVLWD